MSEFFLGVWIGWMVGAVMGTYGTVVGIAKLKQAGFKWEPPR